MCSLLRSLVCNKLSKYCMIGFIRCLIVQCLWIINNSSSTDNQFINATTLRVRLGCASNENSPFENGFRLVCNITIINSIKNTIDYNKSQYNFIKKRKEKKNTFPLYFQPHRTLCTSFLSLFEIELVLK